MKTATPEQVGKALKDLATRIRQQGEKLEMEHILEYLHSQGKTDITIEQLKEDYEKSLHAGKNATSLNTKDTWLKLGYTVEQSEELVKHSGSDLINTIKSYGEVIEPANE